ncbi:MAG: type II toxin-antitoxin system HicB family antitoxin [Chloroflexi bacterium]|nr:type II toxin-antitoxin system HicB family antitoxin [Chloroflexota bacterium]
MVVKINVSLPENVLRELDEAARQSGSSRSAFLAQTVVHFLAAKEAEKKMEQRWRAAAEMDRLREEFGGWDGTAEIMKWRDRH